MTGVMAEQKDLTNNPFAALFPSISVAEQYRTESSKQYDENKQSGIITAKSDSDVMFCLQSY